MQVHCGVTSTLFDAARAAAEVGASKSTGAFVPVANSSARHSGATAWMQATVVAGAAMLMGCAAVQPQWQVQLAGIY